VPIAHAGRAPWVRAPRSRPFQSLLTLAVADVSALATWIRRVHCGVTGHSMLLQFEPQRLSMRCHSCGEETPGWSIGK
jgi:hypothetical protein